MITDNKAMDTLAYYLTQAGEFGDRSEIESAVEAILINWKNECKRIAWITAKEYISKQQLICCQSCHKKQE